MTDAASSKPTVRTSGSPDLPLLTVDSGSYRAVFAPTRGGRLLALSLAGEELLWQNPALLDDDLHPRTPLTEWPQGEGGMGTWANVGGSKTWPAPQGWNGPDEWAGPPDPVLDSGVWTSAVTQNTGSVTVSLLSAADARSGLRMTRVFTFAGDQPDFAEAITLENISGRTIRWSPWEVCQVRTTPGDLITFEGAALPEMRELGLYEGRASARPGPQQVSFETGSGISKHGCVGGSGAIALRRRSGTTLMLSMRPVDGAEYPDGGCRTEVWLQRPTAAPIGELAGLHPDAHLAELEVLGPLVTLGPGESNTVVVTWSTASEGGRR
ncbi:hypothetical protein B7R21_16340 [Subtercola boreus]|uniref:DUF4380 domain-containing protein n=1 Tax=Subtercola boreus TaxID=120213 RepID=A0A3E0VBT9_9MICO|nr:hypothetical protein [Subtercola boreus]RFA07159.1 hypothetical protein B7R21_16340 [Subtercola boreus]